MSNAIISYPDRTLAAGLSGGSWQPTAPLSNLQDPLLSHVARSADATAAASIILADLGVVYPIRALSLCAHNLSVAATIRVSGYSDSGYTALVTDTGIVPAWPAGFTAQQVADYPKTWTFCFAVLQSARYWKWELVDAANPAGYIEVGRCWIGEAPLEPETGVSYGMSLGYQSRDVLEESLGGVTWGEKRIPRRSLVAAFNVLTPAEKRAALIMQKVLTETDEALWITDSMAIAEDMLLEAFLCFIQKPSPLTYPYFNNNEMPISIIERV
jgi:hypothetical protein